MLQKKEPRPNHKIYIFFEDLQKFVVCGYCGIERTSGLRGYGGAYNLSNTKIEEVVFSFIGNGNDFALGRLELNIPA